MQKSLRTFAALFPFAVVPLSGIDQPPRGPRVADGIIVTMEYTDAQGTASFALTIAGNKFRVELGDLLPLMGSAFGGGAGTANTLSTLGNLGTMSAGAYMFSADSGKLDVVVPAMNFAAAIDPSVIAGAMQGRGGFGGGRGGGGRGGPPGGPPGGGRPGRAARGGGQGAPPPDSMAMGGRRRGSAPDNTQGMSVTMTDLGADERMLDQPTHKYRIHVSSRAATGVCAGPNGEEITTNGWFASDLSDGGFTNTFSLVPLLADGIAMPQGSDPFAGKLPSGLPMKITVTCDVNGRSVGTLRVTKIEKASFDADVFQVPPGMQLIDANAMGRRGRRGGG